MEKPNAPSTIKDIARRTGLSLATISKYLNGGHVLEKNRTAIEQAVKDLDFHVNRFARGLKTSRSNTIGIVIPELNNVFSTGIITIVEDILRKSGYGVLVCDCRTDRALEAEAVRFLMDKMVDGIINMPVSFRGAHLQLPLEKGLPVVLIDRMVDLPGVDAVLLENQAAASDATGCLLDLGHRKIGIICGSREVFTTRQRLLGYESAYRARGMEPDLTLVDYGGYTVQGGYEAMKRLLGKRELTAVFVTNYEMTLGAIIAVNELGVRIPGDLSFIGFDNFELSQIVVPKLAIIYQPLDLLAQEVANRMLYRLSGYDGPPQVISHPAKLLLGDSICAV